jgi:hypothetical protein
MATNSVRAQDNSAYDDIPEFGGPSSVGVELNEDNRVPVTGDYIKDSMPGGFAVKQGTMEKHKLK